MRRLSNWIDRLWLAFVLLLWLLPLMARAGVALAQTNQIALQWFYPTANVSADLGFILYSSPTLNTPTTNWPVLTVVMATNIVTFTGTNYPVTNGSLTTFTWPIAATGAAAYFTIASSNLTGISVQAQYQTNNWPVAMPLENIGGFLIVQ